MHKSLLALIVAAAVIPAWAADAPPATPVATATATAAKPTPEQVMEQFRTDMQAKRSDVMAKNLTLSADQAAKFWPLFEQFQKEQNAIIDGQLQAIQKFADGFDQLSDADSVAYVNAVLTRDKKMNELHGKWLAKFQTVVPAKTAARVIQIDRRLGQIAQVQLSSRIPLVR